MLMTKDVLKCLGMGTEDLNKIENIVDVLAIYTYNVGRPLFIVKIPEIEYE